MMYEMRKKAKPTLLPTQGIFNLPHHIDMVWEELSFDEYVSYAQRRNGLAKCYGNDGIRTPVSMVTNPVPYPTELSPQPIRLHCHKLILVLIWTSNSNNQTTKS